MAWNSKASRRVFHTKFFLQLAPFYPTKDINPSLLPPVTSDEILFGSEIKTCKTSTR